MGIQVEEPMAFSPLFDCDRFQAEDPLKKYEQTVKLPGMCLVQSPKVPKMLGQAFCISYSIKHPLIAGPVDARL